MSIKKLVYEKRSCDCCGSNFFKSIWHYSHNSPTADGTYHWKINNVRCIKCGFIFVSPAPSLTSLKKYYRSLHSIFSHQEIDYSIQKRIKIIKRFVKKKNFYLEIGGNKTDKFHNQIKKIFKKTYLVEVNEDHNGPYRSISDIKKINFSVITAYFVLEHLRNPLEFIIQCANKLETNGKLIIEVPNLKVYCKKSDGLMFEHLSHFSPESLELLAIQAGLRKVFIGIRDCSRNYGFVAIFEKEKKNKNILRSKNLLKQIGKSDIKMFTKGVKKIKIFYKKIDKIAQILKLYKSKQVLIWGANINTSILISKYKLKNKIVVIDSDHRKENYLYDIAKIKVLKPLDIKEQFNTFKLIIIMTKRHSREIIKNIRENLSKKSITSHTIILDI